MQNISSRICLLLTIFIVSKFCKSRASPGPKNPIAQVKSLGSAIPLSSSSLKHQDVEKVVHNVNDGELGSLSLNNKKFDYIIVGGGAAGSIVSAKLSEKFNVLLLEAGGEPNILTETPAFALKLLHEPDLDYDYFLNTTENLCKGKIGRYCKLPSGKGLGGSSNLNFMIFTHGHPEDFNYWANYTGDPAWSYASLKTYFKASEIYDSQSPNKSSKYRGFHGKIRVAIPPYIGMAPFITDAVKEYGLPYIEDVNVPFDSEGGAVTQLNIDKRGKRLTPFKAYTSSLKPGSRLTICKFCTAIKILINDQKQATGVLFKQHGKGNRAYAKEEVVLSAGSIETPKLMLLSGIGPRKVLEMAKIKQIHQLPVGLNLQDHVSTILGPFILNSSLGLDIEKDLGVDELVKYTAFGTGPFTTPGVSTTIYLKSSLARKRGENWPDIQLLLVSLKITDKFMDVMDKSFRIEENIFRNSLREYVGKDLISGLALCSRPKSRGFITLNEDNVLDQPNISPNYYSDEDDMKVLIEGYKTAIEIFTTTPTFRKLNSTLIRILYPECDQHESLASSKYIECTARHFTQTVYHPVGTSKMGNQTDPTTVVTSKLKVKGIKDLRVIDGSIMPTITSTNTHAPIIAIAEYGSQILLDNSTQET